ncbi:MAG: hypothetical protein LBV20_00495 [Treponema sp.]|jgi:hypothetical protein|nr:hypothetical protein [Treponema sp.]
MRFPFVFISVLCFLLVLAPISAQTQAELSASAETQEIINPCFPILPLIRTALDGKITWNPEMPMEIPPDSFFLASGKAASIELEIEIDDEADSSVETFVCEWNEHGQLVQFPLLNVNAQESPAMVSVQFNQEGEIAALTLSGKSKAESESETEQEITIDIEIMEMLDGEISLARIHRGDAYYFVAFQYWNNFVSETWYNAEGNAEGLIGLEYVNSRDANLHDVMPYTNTLVIKKECIWGDIESRVTYDYDSWENISQVNTESMSISVLYNNYFQPEYLERTFQVENDLSDAENNQFYLQTEHLTFQWDERNLLVSLKSILNNLDDSSSDETDENSIAEKRYEYTLDDHGNWTERREIIMMRLGSYLFPSDGLSVRRNIQYIIP